MTMSTDFYEVLGVAKTATPDEIRRAYRALARKYHPDVNPDGREEAEHKFKEVSQAYAVLSDEGKRATYDRYGADAVNGVGGGAPDFGGMGGGLGDLFDVFFGAAQAAGGNARAREDINRGNDLRYDLSLTLQECWRA